MRHFKNEANKTYAYDDDVKDEQIKDGLVEITKEEANAITRSLLTEEQAIAHFKSLYLKIFNAKLKELDYDSIATVQLWMSDATFGAEATKIMTWYKAIITKNHVILTEAKATRVIPTDEAYKDALPKYI